MRSALFRLFAIICLMIFLTPNDSASVQERRIALVIGNGAYTSSPLANPVNDARDMAVALKKLGFSVRLNINANQRSMENAIRTFGKDLRSGGVGLFYFAGHGVQVHGRNYLIPIGANIESEADAKYESVDAGRVLSQMYEAENGLNIIILDACRDNPYASSFRSSEKGLAKMDAPTGSILAYATAPGSVAADGTDRNGLYTSMLLKHMMEPNLIIERIFKKVRIDVMKKSANRQVPWESSSLTGDFYFSPKRGIVVKKSLEVESKKLKKETPQYASITAKVLKPIAVEGSPFKGSYDAPVVITNFSDYQCPYCAKLQPLLEKVFEKYPQDVKIVFKNFPLKYHKFSLSAAIAAHAAGKQGKFWEFHDLLFKNYNRLNAQKVKQIARQLNLDLVQFDKDQKDPQIQALIKKDWSDATKAGVRGTPTVFINGRLLRGSSHNLPSFQSIIEKELEKVR